MAEELENISLYEQIKTCPEGELDLIAEELRDELIQDVAKTGGHLASNLGSVELTIALHRVFDSPKDRIVWDVGHQAYIHKMITGRREEMATLRQLGGLSGFPKRRESEHDAYDSGHSGTSISAALGYAAARDLKGLDYECIAVIGDGALTGGVAFEALNAAGSSKTSLIVILNDNAMSISRNVGGLARHLQKVRRTNSYLKFKKGVKNVLQKSPTFLRRLTSARDALKYALLPGAIFEELGFKYFGPVDGHDIEAMCQVFESVKHLDRPVLVHCVTKKGKGFGPAESNPEKYHGTGPFDPKTADDVTVRDPGTWSEVFGKLILDRAFGDSRICAVTASMIEGTGLSSMKKQMPDRVFDAGIAEQHAVSFAAGLALSGMKPVVAIYSTFLQRAYDQVITEVCLQKLPVIFCIDRAGIVGADGETHQGIYDINYLSGMPNMTILSPRDDQELENMFDYALSLNAPCAIRYPRGVAPKGARAPKDRTKVYVPAPQCLRDGMDVVFLSDGGSLPAVLDAASLLESRRISCAVWDLKQLKPLPEHFLTYVFSHWHNVVTVEDGDVCCGIGARIGARSAEKASCRVLNIGWPDAFIEQGSQSQLRRRFGMDAAGIADRTERFLENKA